MYNLQEIDSYDAILRAMPFIDSLIDLVEKRTHYCNETRERLKTWLLNGSLILDSDGHVAFFYPDKRFDTDEVSEITYIEDGFGIVLKNTFPVKGKIENNPRKMDLPLKGLLEQPTICACCGKEVTIKDIYKGNFQVCYYKRNYARGSFIRVVHDGECFKFFEQYDNYSEAIDDMLFAAKRVFGKIENVCTSQTKNRKGYLIVKVSFTVKDYLFEVEMIDPILMEIRFKSKKMTKKNCKGVLISYDCSNVRCYFIEEKFNEWKEKYL